MRITTPQHPLVFVWTAIQIISITILFMKFGILAGGLGIVLSINYRE